MGRACTAATTTATPRRFLHSAAVAQVVDSRIYSGKNLWLQFPRYLTESYAESRREGGERLKELSQLFPSRLCLYVYVCAYSDGDLYALSSYPN